jgi:hypothetical protein
MPLDGVFELELGSDVRSVSIIGGFGLLEGLEFRDIAEGPLLNSNAAIGTGYCRCGCIGCTPGSGGTLHGYLRRLRSMINWGISIEWKARHICYLPRPPRPP